MIFPAGEVAHLNWGEHLIADPKWSDTAARLARKANCPTVPLFFGGSNSIPFQMVGTIYPGLRTLNLPRELMKKRSHTIQVRSGSSISGSVLRTHASASEASDYLRARVYLLSSRLNGRPASAVKRKNEPGVTPAANRREEIAGEIAALPAERMLGRSDEFEVYLASENEIPKTLFEIGRCREMTFREAGEGTNNSIDLDRFDSYYQHLFLWNRRDQAVAGAYRIAAMPDILPQYGPKGLYTSTLFQYSPDFFQKLGNAFELGRSFVRPEYQRHYAPLLLLWKAIAKCIEMRPECPVLFGAVSISGAYHPLSRALIMNFMTGHMSSDLAEHVKARRGYRAPIVLPKHIKQLSCLVNTLDELSATVSDLERDGKGVPVLLRHYLKLGGQFLGFNVDSNFSNTLDGLISPICVPSRDQCWSDAWDARGRPHSGPGMPSAKAGTLTLELMPADDPFRAAIEQFIRTHARPVEKYSHQPRLYALTQQIGKGLAYDDDVVFAAAWLHDLGVFVGHRPEDPDKLARWDSVGYACAKAPEVLKQCGFPEEKVPATVEAIRTHQPGADPLTPEGTVLRDADILEQLGSVGILRAVCKIGRDTRFSTFSDVIPVLQKALDTLPAQLRTESARQLAAERIDVLRRFLQGVADESGGKLD